MHDGEETQCNHCTLKIKKSVLRIIFNSMETQENLTRKERKRIQILKEEIKLSAFIDNIKFFYTRSPKES